MTQVFISYSRRDWLIAEGLAANLDAMGYRIWIDTGIKPTRPYAEEIADALNACQAATVIWTKDSIVSEWVLWEANRALEASKLVQLRVPDLPVELIPAPFNQFTIYHQGGPEEVARRIDEIASAQQLNPTGASDTGSAAPEAPSEAARLASEQQSSQFSPREMFLYSSSLLGLGALFLAGRFSWYISTAAIAAGIMLLIIMLFYSVFLSVSRFTDRFGRQMVFESLAFGTMASLFAGAVGGYPYAANHIERLPGISEPDLFMIKYVRVIVITTLIGSMLSYLLLALIRYMHLRRRNLGPTWSRRDASLQIAVPIALVVLLTLGAAQLADQLARIGLAVDGATLGYIDWLGSGQCPNIRYCVPAGTETFCKNCTVGDMSRVDVVLILSIFLWSQHVFHMKKFGANLLRILTTSLPIIVAAIVMVSLFELHPDAFGRTADIRSWRILIFQIPWVFLIFWTVFTVTRSAATLERRAIVDRDQR